MSEIKGPELRLTLGQGVQIGKDITVKLVKWTRSRVHLKVVAPEDVSIERIDPRGQPLRKISKKPKHDLPGCEGYR